MEVVNVSSVHDIREDIRYDNLTPTFGTVIHDIDLTDLTFEKSKFLYDIFCEKKLLILPNQILNNKQLLSVANVFGKVWENDGLIEMQEDDFLSKKHLPWHVDLTYYPSQILPNRLLYATELQGSGMPTDFLDTIEGIKLLDQEIFDFLRNTSIHCKAPYKTPWDAVMRRPALNWHHKHNSWGLVADELFTVHIEDHDNYQEFIKPVIKQMMTKNTIYSHEWQENDLMIYDNWSLMHNSIRILKRITWDQDWYKFDVDVQFDNMMMLGRGTGGWSHDGISQGAAGKLPQTGF